jgi:hypothetical protein
LLGESNLFFGWVRADELRRAIGAAKAISAENQVHIVVGLLRANITWH